MAACNLKKPKDDRYGAKKITYPAKAFKDGNILTLHHANRKQAFGDGLWFKFIFFQIVNGFNDSSFNCFPDGSFHCLRLIMLPKPQNGNNFFIRDLQ